MSSNNQSREQAEYKEDRVANLTVLIGKLYFLMLEVDVGQIIAIVIGADSMGPAELGPPPNLGAQGPIIWLSPPIFCYTKFNFYVLFQQVNATATRFTQCHMVFSKFIELNKFSQSILIM